MHINLLIFPCGSEVALEINRSLKFSRHITMFGANSVDDHGRFVFENYIGGLPFFNEKHFIDQLNGIIEENNIDAIYPAMDAVITFLSSNSEKIKCKIIGSKAETNAICSSKTDTYRLLSDAINCPVVYRLDNIQDTDFPLFLKPNIGYGSRGVKKVNNISEIHEHLKAYPDCIILEYLPGIELTVDCFTDRNGILKFWGPRIRERVSNGISVHTKPYTKDLEKIQDIVEAINRKIEFRGAWFVQLKYNSRMELSVLEVASRLGGSSALHRGMGVNFSLLSVFDAFDSKVDVFQNPYQIEMDRALDNKYKLNLDFDTIYSDFDDCLVINDKVNTALVAFLYQSLNKGYRLVLITRHAKDLNATLMSYRLNNIFDEIIHLRQGEKKSEFINPAKAIFIDDSFAERYDVHLTHRIPVFAPDNIELLLN